MFSPTFNARWYNKSICNLHCHQSNHFILNIISMVNIVLLLLYNKHV